MGLTLTISFNDEIGDKLIKKIGSLDTAAIRNYILELVKSDLGVSGNGNPK